MAVRILSTGAFIPEKILTNADLEKMVDTNDTWIVERTGIRERHIAPKEIATSDMAGAAVLQALERAHISGSEIDLIIVATVTSDHVFPSTACLIQAKIGAEGAACFDLEAACSGFLYALETATLMMNGRPNRYRKAVVIGAEKLSSITDWTDRGTCILFGDGAACAVLSLDPSEGAKDTIVASQITADGRYAHLLSLPAGGSRNPATHETVENKMHCIKMAGPEVFKLAVTAMAKACKMVMQEAGVSGDQIKYLIPHQANLRILSAVGSRVDLDPEKQIYVNVDRYGNTSAASIAICLNEMNEKGLIQRGDLLLLTAFGGGLTIGAMLIRW